MNRKRVGMPIDDDVYTKAQRFMLDRKSTYAEFDMKRKKVGIRGDQDNDEFLVQLNSVLRLEPNIAIRDEVRRLCAPYG